MRFRSVQLHNFRNILSLELFPCDGVNLIYGENAQGKTNLIEALWLFSGMKSFRGAKEAELISFGQKEAAMCAVFFSEKREQTVSIALGAHKRTELNGVKCAAPSELCGKLPMVAFSPSHLSLVREGPALRRRFLDDAISQLYPSYEGNLQYYSRALFQRNRLLRDVAAHAALLDTLDIWDSSMAKAGAQIICLRKRYIALLDESASRVYSGISGGREEMSLRYRCSIDGVEEGMDIASIREKFLAAFHNSRGEDLRQVQTLRGAHRDDLEISLDTKSVRLFGSQGQQRSCVLALKLAECGIIEGKAGKKPVILLDDVMSELDRGRRDFLLRRIRDQQVFITCCENGIVPMAAQGKRFLIQNGGAAEG